MPDTFFNLFPYIVGTMIFDGTVCFICLYSRQYIAWFWSKCAWQTLIFWVCACEHGSRFTWFNEVCWLLWLTHSLLHQLHGDALVDNCSDEGFLLLSMAFSKFVSLIFNSTDISCVNSIFTHFRHTWIRKTIFNGLSRKPIICISSQKTPCISISVCSNF